MTNCGVVLGCFRFIKTLLGREGAKWTERIEDLEVVAEWVS